jgi:hypothetical protein
MFEIVFKEPEIVVPVIEPPIIATAFAFCCNIEPKPETPASEAALK